MTLKSDFFKHQAQTSPYPLCIEISHAKGSYIYDINGKKTPRLCSWCFCK